MAITKTDFPYELETFSLAHIMDSPILRFKEDVEEVSSVGRSLVVSLGTSI